MNILFVDDDYITIDAVVMDAKLRKHNVHVAGNAQEALEKLLYNKYDVVFLDIMMATGSYVDLDARGDGRYVGLAVLDKIHVDGAYIAARQARIYLITNWREEPFVDAVAAKYGRTIIRKPLGLDVVRGAIGG